MTTRSSSNGGFMGYDLGFIDREQKTLQTLDNPFWPRASPLS